jgi:hypothetical protein
MSPLSPAKAPRVSLPPTPPRGRAPTGARTPLRLARARAAAVEEERLVLQLQGLAAAHPPPPLQAVARLRRPPTRAREKGGGKEWST